MKKAQRLRLVTARLADLDRILAVEREVFPHEPFSRTQIRYLLRSVQTRTRLLMCGGEPAGFVAIWWRKGASTCRIIDLAVRRRFRRLGLGVRLVQAVLRFASREGYVGITLEVAEANRPARALYLSQGFGEERRLPDYYDDGHHAIRMVRWLAAGLSGGGRSRPPARRGRSR